mgnify:CR=1 FL=1
MKKISKAHIRRRRKQTARERQEKVKRNLWIKRPCTVRGQTERRSHMVSKENAPEVEGILVIADGGGNAVVAKNLTEAVQALFGVEAHKIKIMKRAST